MCVTYRPSREEKLAEMFAAPVANHPDWPNEVWHDYPAPIITGDGRVRESQIASYGMVPKSRYKPGTPKYNTVNARVEDVGVRKAYRKAWLESRLCLVPCRVFYEPNWETGEHIRYRIGMVDGQDFAVAGLWTQWHEADGTSTLSFTQLTMNADDHPLMRRFHRAEDEKRSLIIIPQTEWDDWLGCRNPEEARSFVRPYPAELMVAEPAPSPPKATKKKQSVQSSFLE